MTRRRDIEVHLRSLKDIDEILGTMKNLSQMETRKLAHFLSSQRRVVTSIRAAAADFIQAHPHFATPPTAACSVLIVIGAERGFCGGFNDELCEALDRHLQENSSLTTKLVLVGNKLSTSLEHHPLLADALAGATVGQEVDAVITRLLDSLSDIDDKHGSISVTVFYHHYENDEVQVVSLLPPFLHNDRIAAFGFPPLLNLSPDAFYSELTEHYLFAALHEMFFASLMAEHNRRIQHLDAALQRLEEKTATLGKKRNILRQEEITEEIEVILLSCGVLEYY